MFSLRLLLITGQLSAHALLFAGEATMPVVLPPQPDTLQFTFQACLCGEYRENDFDFSDARDSDPDDALDQRLAAQPHAKVKTTLNFQGFWLADTADAWYRANGTARVRNFRPSACYHAGDEIDFALNAKLTKYLDVLLCYSHFFAGQYLEDTVVGDDAEFAYLILTVNY